MKYTRKKLIELCDKAIVPYHLWNDRDTPSAQVNIATIRAYLLAGCNYRLNLHKPKTDENTIWIEIKHYVFESTPDWQLYYMPTEKRINESNGGDWY